MLPRALKGHFTAAIQRMLRAVVRHLIAQGVTYPALTQMLKEVYVEVAEAEFALPFKRQTDSRLSLVTGLNRKEIARLRTRQRKPQKAPVAIEDNLVTHVIGRWMAGPPYAANDGTPLCLTYESERPNSASFARLVRDLTVDIPVRSVLDELVRADAVTLRSDGAVELRREVNIPVEDAAAKLALLGTDPGELFCTIMHNIEHPEAARLQRKVVYDNIGADALAEIRGMARRSGEEFIRSTNALLAGHDRDRNPHAAGGQRTRVVLGTYYFEEEVRPPAPSPAGEKRSGLPGRIRRSR